MRHFVLPVYGIPMLEITRSRNRLIFRIGIPILVRWHLYIETAPWAPDCNQLVWRAVWMNVSNATPKASDIYKTPVHFINGISIVIQIRWKFRFSLASILTKWSLHAFVHATTAVLSWHVQNLVEIWSSLIVFRLRLRLRQGFIQHKITYGSFTSGLHCKTIRTYWTNMNLA